MAKDDKAVNVEIRPLDDRVVVEPLEAEEKTAGGILLPDTAKQKPQRGKVVAVGPGKLLDNGKRAALAVAGRRRGPLRQVRRHRRRSRTARKSRSCARATSSRRSSSNQTRVSQSQRSRVTEKIIDSTYSSADH